MTSYLRYKQQIRTVQDADDAEIESWITVRGNHIPIKKGQSKEDAVKSFIESKGGKYKKESYGKYYVKYGEGENRKYASPRNDLIYSDKSRAGFFGSEKEAQEYAKKLNHTDPYAGTEFAVKNYKRTVLPYEVESEEQEPEMGKGYSAKMHELFSKHYDTLYKHAEKDVQYGDLVKEFDKKLQSDPEFKKEVQSFVKERGDVLSSDREVKAYMLARNEANKTSASKTESKQPTDIMDWKFEDVMKLPVSDPRVHKYIAKNNWLKTSTVATIAEAFGNTEDLYMEIDRMSNAKGYGWDKIKWGKK